MPPEISILSTGNEGLNMIELGIIENNAVTLNISYMQVHPAMNNDVLPLGVSIIVNFLSPYYYLAKLFD